MLYKSYGQPKMRDGQNDILFDLSVALIHILPIMHSAPLSTEFLILTTKDCLLGACLFNEPLLRYVWRRECVDDERRLWIIG